MRIDEFLKQRQEAGQDVLVTEIDLYARGTTSCGARRSW